MLSPTGRVVEFQLPDFGQSISGEFIVMITLEGTTNGAATQFVVNASSVLRIVQVPTISTIGTPPVVQMGDVSLI